MVKRSSFKIITNSSLQPKVSSDLSPCSHVAKIEEVNGVKLWLLEDNRTLASRRDRRSPQEGVLISLHIIENSISTPHSAKTVCKQEAPSNIYAQSALSLICGAAKTEPLPLLVTGTSYGCSSLFLRRLQEMSVSFAVKLRPTTFVRLNGQERQLRELVGSATWRTVTLVHARSKVQQPYLVTRFEGVQIAGVSGDLFVAQIGGVTDDVHRGTIFGFSNAVGQSDEELLYALNWPRLNREISNQRQREENATRRQTECPPFEDDDGGVSGSEADIVPVRMLGRPNNSFVKTSPAYDATPWESRRSLPERVNMVELFAGVGGMALGFLQAESENKTLDLLFSGEVEPIYAHTLRLNHHKWNEIRGGTNLPTNVEAVDLTSQESFERIEETTRTKGDVTVVVGGPPCQGFSAANRNSWSSDNPNNRLVEVFFRHVEAMQPRVFLMENVQGIMWTNSQSSKLNVADELQRRLERAGYITFPHLLDAACFGVPQHRVRYFLLGIHQDLGYQRGDFGENGLFPAPTHGPNTPLPFVTVEEAIGDLPAIENAQSCELLPYQEPDNPNDFLQKMRHHAPQNQIADHVTSRHAAYVIERYRHIRAGGNWQDIKHMMTNYAQIERTHSNIYRRLKEDEPSITMGHYRKSMLIHPSQHRGLSLREAMRLQSFPDWYRFAGNVTGTRGGLVHQQQQLANAVCPLLLKAIAQEIFKL